MQKITSVHIRKLCGLDDLINFLKVQFEVAREVCDHCLEGNFLIKGGDPKAVKLILPYLFDHVEDMPVC